MSIESIHQSMEDKAAKDKDYYLDVWTSHIQQLCRMTNDTSFTYKDYSDLKARLLAVASENWERNHG